MKVSRRVDSFIASVVLDLTAILEQSEVYELAMNDFLAVGANPEIHIVTDTSNQYLRNGQDFIREVSPAYSETWQPKDGWKVAPHHQEALPFWLERIGRPWDLLAISTVLRDRVFLSAVRTLVAET